MKTLPSFFLVLSSFATLHNAQAYVSDEEIKAKRRIEDIKTCEASLPNLKAEYEKLLKERAYWKAAGKLRFCASTLPNNSDLNALIADAEIKEHQSIIRDPKSSKADKTKAKERLVIDYPEAGKAYASEVQKLDKAEQTKQSRKLKSQGVALGMSREQVVASSWGRPRNITRTTTVRGETETWHYGFPNFLYFENGVLTQIHN